MELKEMTDLILGMDRYLRDHVQDEEIFARWLYTVPDGLTREDAEEMANESETFHEVCTLFANILVEDGEA